MKIEIDEYCQEQIVTVNGKDFLITRIPKEIDWKCCNCGKINSNDDDYIEINFVECSKCKSSYGIDIDSEGNIINIQDASQYQQSNGLED